MFRVLFVFFAALLFSAAAQAQGNYQIKPGDTLRIEVIEDNSLNRNALVLPDGSISVPLAGSVRAAGMTVGQLQSTLQGLLAPNFAAPPTVFVSVGEVAEQQYYSSVAVPQTNEIYVTGEVANPGKIDATEGATILHAIAQAGGLTRFAADKRIQLRRGDDIYLYNYRTTGGGIPSSTVLVPGDVIVVPVRRLFE